ncbi:MAG TPA: cytochrome c biogenesis protein CcdA [Candidatus Hydrogenedentes bacterium]|nr:cytochrome c biogenesis protein CcdA [Candidatus Hydrogenedentota bacterium]
MRNLLLISHCVLLGTLLLWVPVAHAQFGQSVKPEITFTPEQDILSPGSTFRGWLTVTFPEPWHVNARHPKDDALIPTTLELSGDSSPVRIAKVVYPQPKSFRFEFSEEEVLVYGPVFSVGMVIEASPEAPSGAYAIPLKLRYQACNNTTCMPPRSVDITITVNVDSTSPQSEPRTPPDELDWSAAEDLSGAVPSENQPEEPALGANAAPFTNNQEDVKTNNTGTETNWQDLAKRFTLAGRLDGFVGTASFLDFIDAAEQGKSAATNSFANRRIWIVLLLILGGGVLLNLTPCVLPMIPINLAIIGAGARAGSRRQGFLLGLAYGAGISIVYGLLGLAVVLGISTAFGTINATVWFNGLIAGLFFLLALAMFDLIQIDFSRYQSKINLSGRAGNMMAALGMGAVSALLAGACVAPVVIYTVVYAQDLYSQGNRWSLVLPFLLGVGMALPWPFLGAGLSLLPKPGKWMTRVKQGFGVLILLFAFYYAHLGWTLWQTRTVSSGNTEGWEVSLEDGLRRALQENRPVIIDFWATWCKNCAVMNSQTLKDPDVVQRLSGYVRIKFQAEDLEEPKTRAVTQFYQVKGLPTFIILKPGQENTPDTL